MAAGDAKPVPIKGQAYRITFPVYATTGKLAPGITMLSTISIDGASPTYGTRPSEISGGIGLYTLDLSASEMNGQTIAGTATPLTAQTTVLTTPWVLYTQGPSAGFYAQVEAIGATAVNSIGDHVANRVWATSSRTLSSIDNVKASIVSTVWATSNRTLTSIDAVKDVIVSAVWATPGRSLDGDVGGNLVGDVQGNVDGNLVGDVEGDVQGGVLGNVGGSVAGSVSSVTGSVGSIVSIENVKGSIVSSVWATPTRTLSSMDEAIAAELGDIANAVWATATKAITSVGTGAITTSSFAAGAIDAASIAASALTTSEIDQTVTAAIADRVLNRSIVAGNDGVRPVKEALAAIRNKVSLVGANTGIVYASDDSTTLYTFTVTSDSQATRITGVDPT